MASTTATADRSAQPRITITVPGDRSSAFRTARRHTLLVKSLRVALPLASLAMMSSYWIAASRTFTFSIGPVKVPSVSLSTENLTMERPRYEGFGKDGSRYDVTAASAVQDLRQQGPIKLNEIAGKLIQPGQGTIVLKSPRGTFDSKANILVLMDKVDIDGDNGFKARMTEATLLLKEHKVISKQPVLVEMPTGQVRGNAMVLLQSKREVTFSNGVKTTLKPQGNPAVAPKAADTKAATRTLGAGNAPVEVDSQSLHVDDTRKVALFSGNVTARQGEATLNAKSLEAQYDGQPVTLGAQPAATQTPGANPAAGKLKRLIARDDVVMTQAGDRATSANGDFDAINETALLTGGVVMTSAPDRRAVSDRAELDQRADTALLTGTVEVTQGRNIMRGRRLFLDRKAGKLQLSAPAEPGQPAGRIFTRFYQQQADAGAKRKVPLKPTPAAEAGGLALRSDPNAPVDIEADTLDANDTAKTAIYRGNVRAVQGDSTIQTAELIAHYTGSAAGGTGLGKQDSRAAQAKPNTELTRVQSKSRITVTSGPDQSATGDAGDFDVKSNRIAVVGNVTLKQGKNITHGPKAIIDLNTGHYQMEGAAPSPWRSAPPSNSGGGLLPDLTAELPKPSPRVTDPENSCPPGRSCAVFHPSDAKAAASKAKLAPAAPGGQTPSAPPPAPATPPAKAGRAAATSSWDATTVAPKAPN